MYRLTVHCQSHESSKVLKMEVMRNRKQDHKNRTMSSNRDFARRRSQAEMGSTRQKIDSEVGFWSILSGEVYGPAANGFLSSKIVPGS